MYGDMHDNSSRGPSLDLWSLSIDSVQPIPLKLTLFPFLPPSPPPSLPQQVQAYVQHVTTQTKHNIGVKTEAEKAAALKAKKEAKEKEDVELKLLFMQVRERGREGGREGGRKGGADTQMSCPLHRLTDPPLPPSLPPS